MIRARLQTEPGAARALAASDLQRQSAREGAGHILVSSAIFFAELLLFFALSFPRIDSMSTFAFGDPGASLVADSFLARGKLPTIDFGYIYGLLPLAVGRAWFAIFGRTPAAVIGFTVLMHTFVAWGLARVAYHLRFGRAGVLLTMAAIPFGIAQIQYSFAHAMETPLLIHAFAFQASGKKSAALAMAVVAAFTKPSFAIIYAALLVLLIFSDTLIFGRGDLKRVILHLLPAAIAAFALAAFLAAIFGWMPLLHTALPFIAARMYSSLNHGFFFGVGRYFWRPPGAGIGYYLGTMVLFWFVTTFLILFASIQIIYRIIDRRSTAHASPFTTREEIIITVALMQLAVIFILFGHAGTGAYYVFMLIIGAACLVRGDSLWRIGFLTLMMLALLGWRQIFSESIRAWRTTRPSPQAANLWIAPDVLAEWTSIRPHLAEPGVLLANRWGAARLLFPDANTFETWFLDPTIARRPEIDAAIQQIDQAHTLYFPTLWADHQDLCTAPGFEGPLRRFKPTGRGKYFLEYQAIAPVADSDQPDVRRR